MAVKRPMKPGDAGRLVRPVIRGYKASVSKGTPLMRSLWRLQDPQRLFEQVYGRRGARELLRALGRKALHRTLHETEIGRSLEPSDRAGFEREFNERQERAQPAKPARPPSQDPQVRSLVAEFKAQYGDLCKAEIERIQNAAMGMILPENEGNRALARVLRKHAKRTTRATDRMISRLKARVVKLAVARALREMRANARRRGALRALATQYAVQFMNGPHFSNDRETRLQVELLGTPLEQKFVERMQRIWPDWKAEGFLMALRATLLNLHESAWAEMERGLHKEAGEQGEQP